MQRLYVDGSGESKQEMSAEDAAALAQAAGRGLRSSVGVYGFGAGGIVLESGKLQGEVTAPLVSQIPMPESWRGVLFVRREAEGLHGDAERTAFAGLKLVPFELTAELTTARGYGNSTSGSLSTIYRFCFSAHSIWEACRETV